MFAPLPLKKLNDRSWTAMDTLPLSSLSIERFPFLDFLDFSPSFLSFPLRVLIDNLDRERSEERLEKFDRF